MKPITTLPFLKVYNDGGRGLSSNKHCDCLLGTHNVALFDCFKVKVFTLDVTLFLYAVFKLCDGFLMNSLCVFVTRKSYVTL